MAMEGLAPPFGAEFNSGSFSKLLPPDVPQPREFQSKSMAGLPSKYLYLPGTPVPLNTLPLPLVPHSALCFFPVCFGKKKIKICIYLWLKSARPCANHTIYFIWPLLSNVAS